MTFFNILLFDGFETLDAMGPAEIAGRLDRTYRMEFSSADGGIVKSAQGVKVETRPLSAAPGEGIFLIPGGMGSRQLVHDPVFLEAVRESAESAEFVLTVCTGSALLARTGLLDGRKATTNKKAFEWVVSMGPDVDWLRNARWASDGKFYTSSGVSAGMDMVLGFIADREGLSIAEQTAESIEYIWNRDRHKDPFAI